MSRKIVIETAITFVFMFIIATTSSAATYFYVDADAGQNGDGSLFSPWDHPNELENNRAAITAAAAYGPVVVYLDRQDRWTFTGDDRLFLASYGTSWLNSITYDGLSWTGDTQATGQDRAEIVIDGSDNIGVWIQNGVEYNSGLGTTYDAYVKVYGFDINGSDKTDTCAPLQANNASHIFIENCIVHNAGNAKATSPGIRFATHARGTTGLTITDLNVKNCTIYKTSTHGIAFYPIDSDNVGDIRVEGCTISDFGSNYAAAAGIQVMSADSGTIRGNTIHDSATKDAGAGIKLEHRHSPPSHFLIESNYIYGSSGNETHHGIELTAAIDIIIKDNRLLNLSGYGIFIYDSPLGYGSCSEIRLFNNKIYNTTGHAIANANSTGTISELSENIIKQSSNSRAVHNTGTITEHSSNVMCNRVSTWGAVWQDNKITT
jgi:hypothetical protein